MLAIAEAEFARPPRRTPEYLTVSHMPATLGKSAKPLPVTLIGSRPIAGMVAVSLLEAGHELTLCVSRGVDLDSIASRGGRIARSIEEACRSAGAVCTMFEGDEEVEAAVLAEGGVIGVMMNNAVHIGFSRISVACADRLVEAHWDAGQRYVSAPISERANPASAPTFSIVAGGCEDAIAEVQPLLDAVGEVTARLRGWPSLANAVQHEQILALYGPSGTPVRSKHKVVRRGAPQ